MSSFSKLIKDALSGDYATGRYELVSKGDCATANVQAAVRTSIIKKMKQHLDQLYSGEIEDKEIQPVSLVDKACETRIISGLLFKETKALIFRNDKYGWPVRVAWDESEETFVVELTATSRVYVNDAVPPPFYMHEGPSIIELARVLYERSGSKPPWEQLQQSLRQVWYRKAEKAEDYIKTLDNQS